MIGALEGEWSVELYASDTPLRVAPRSHPAVRTVRGVLRRAGERTALDKHERWSRRRFGGWWPDVDAAVLIGLPMSPLVFAGVRLRMREIPYVVDVGDPWVLTHPDPVHRWPASLRAARAEQLLWAGASGAIVTTGAVARALSAIFPSMLTLVRPNGYELAVPTASREPGQDQGAANELRLIHFGGLGPARVDIGAVLRKLAECGRWERVSFAQYGSDWSGMLDSVGPRVGVTCHEQVPWGRATEIAQSRDAVVVVGNHNSYQLPSKAVQCLTLPIPRIAVTNGCEDDAMTGYVADKAGWLAVGHDDPSLAERVHRHVTRRWSAAELAPPASEAWCRVSSEIGAFINCVLTRQGQASLPDRFEEQLSGVRTSGR